MLKGTKDRKLSNSRDNLLESIQIRDSGAQALSIVSSQQNIKIPPGKKLPFCFYVTDQMSSCLILGKSFSFYLF
jgi:hypothetical protein